MLNFGFRKNYGPIGLDMGQDAIKMTQFRLVQGIPQLWEARSSCGLKGKRGQESSVSTVQLIKELLEVGDFQGRDCVSCLPNSKLKITSVRIDQADQAKTGASLYKEAAYRFGLDPDRDSIRYIPAGMVRQGAALKQEMILFATDNDTIKHHIDLLESAGLIPQGIDPLPCALFRAFGNLGLSPTDGTNTVVYVDVGCCYTTIALGREGQLSFVKQIPLGADHFDQVVADNLGVDKAEARALRMKMRGQGDDPDVGQAACLTLPSNRQGPSDAGVRLDVATRQKVIDCIRSVSGELGHELSRCLRYYTVTFRGQRIHQIVLCGGGANENILLDTLRTHLGCKVYAADALSNVREAQLGLGHGNSINEWIVSWGLALKRVPSAETVSSEAKTKRALTVAGQKLGC